MKFAVIANSSGKIIAIVPTVLPSYKSGAPRLGAPIAGRGNKIREIELPDQPLNGESWKEIRAQLEARLKKGTIKKSSSGQKTQKRLKKT